MVEYVADAWRSFSRTKETPYKTAEAGTVLFPFEGDPAQVVPGETISNEAENKGNRDADSFDIINKMLVGNHSQRAHPDILAIAFASILQKVTTDQPNAGTDANTYRHYLERLLTSAGAEMSAAAITMIEHDSVQQKVYTGIVGQSVELKVGREGFAQLSWDFIGSGSEANDATAKPSLTGESYLLAGDMHINRGTGLTGTVAGANLAVASGSDLSAKVREMTYKISSGVKPVYEFGDQTKTVTRFEQGPRFEHELKVQFEMEDVTHHDAVFNETEYGLYIPLIGSLVESNYNYTCGLWFPQVQYKLANKTVADGKLIVDADFMIQEDATLGSVIIEIINGQAAYLG